MQGPVRDGRHDSQVPPSEFHWASARPPPPPPDRGRLVRAVLLGALAIAALGALALYLADWLAPSDEGDARAEEQAQRRGVPAFKPGPPAPPEIPEGPPFVGESGLDAYDYPLRRPDSTVLFALLQQQRFAELDVAMNFYQDAFEKDYRKEDWPRAAIESFGVPHFDVEKWLDAWIAASPDSFGAWASRAIWHEAMGWELRGRKYADKTMESQFAAMHVEHAKAIADFERALELRPKAVAALQGLMSIARTAGRDADVKALHDRAIAICPKCLSVRVTYVLALGPKWGGSHALMDAAAAAAPVKRNRKLELLAGLSAYDRCRTLAEEERFDEALAECEAAVSHGPFEAAMCERGRIINRQKRYAEALPVLDAGLRLDPQEFDCLRSREFARRSAEDYFGAAQDVLTLRRLQPLGSELDELVDWTLQRARYDANQAAKAGDRDTEAKIRALGNAILPGGGDARHPGGVDEDGVAELQKKIAAAPDDFDLRLKLDLALASRRRFPEIVAMWNAFIDAHPDHARAWDERGGAKWHAGDREGAIADTQHACDLGLDAACRDVPRMRHRAGL